MSLSSEESRSEAPNEREPLFAVTDNFNDNGNEPSIVPTKDRHHRLPL
jgi:hypothetical protein